jgi:hypothetical protein
MHPSIRRPGRGDLHVWSGQYAFRTVDRRPDRPDLLQRRQRGHRDDKPAVLAVNGTITTKEVMVTNTGWSDYVFRPEYRLKPLSEVAAYIDEHQHLPDIPSEGEVRENGVSLGEMQAKLLAKVEELTLHMIQADERNNRLERQNRELQERIARLEAVGGDPGNTVR